MGCVDRQLHLDRAVRKIDESILPSNIMMLDILLEAAALARPGIDGYAYATELRRIVAQLEELTRQVEAISPDRPRAQEYRAASEG